MNQLFVECIFIHKLKQLVTISRFATLCSSEEKNCTLPKVLSFFRDIYINILNLFIYIYHWHMRLNFLLLLSISIEYLLLKLPASLLYNKEVYEAEECSFE